MGWLSKLKTAIGVAEKVAPMLPIGTKAKRIVAKVGSTERDVESIADEFKKPKAQEPS